MKLGYTILYVEDVPATLAAWRDAQAIGMRRQRCVRADSSLRSVALCYSPAGP